MKKDILRIKNIKEGTIYSKPTHFVSGLYIYKNTKLNRFLRKRKNFFGTKDDCNTYLNVIKTKAIK